jgi:hypothetical protein
VDIRGTIVDFQQMEQPGPERTAVLGAILVEGAVEEDTRYDKASIAVRRSTGVFKQIGVERRPATFADLRIGQFAEARFAGPVRETYPLQGTAAEIVILEPAR